MAAPSRHKRRKVDGLAGQQGALGIEPSNKQQNHHPFDRLCSVEPAPASSSPVLLLRDAGVGFYRTTGMPTDRHPTQQRTRAVW